MSNFSANQIVVTNSATGCILDIKVCLVDGSLCSPEVKIKARGEHTFDLSQLGFQPDQKVLINVYVKGTIQKPYRRDSQPVTYQPNGQAIGYSVDGKLNKWKIVGPYAVVNA